MKILVVYRQINNMAGGVERMSSLIMNEMITRGHQVEYITLDTQDAVSFYLLNERIEWHRLGIGDPSKTADFKTRLTRILSMRKIVKEFNPDTILAFQEASFLSVRLAVMGLNIPVIAAERNSPSRFDFMNKTKRQLAFFSFRFARFVTIQCHSFKKYYPAGLQNKIETIPNPIFPVADISERKSNIILSVGRLEYQKNYAVLIEAFSKISDLFPEWNLTIVGEGEDRMKLETLIRQNNLQERISLPGPSSDLKKYFNDAKIFCLPSRWEGFPNALAEAMAYGLPSAGFADCDGVNELIKSGKNGILASGNSKSDTLAEALKILIENHKLRDEMSAAAIQTVGKYAPSSIFDHWERLLLASAGK